MADPFLLGIALQNAQGGVDAYNQGTKNANQNFAEDLKLRDAAMELALRDASLEDRHVKLGLDLLRSIPARNEQMIESRIQKAIDPLLNVRAPMAPEGPDRENIQRYLDMATGQRPATNYSIPSVGYGAKAIKQSYDEGRVTTPQQSRQVESLPPTERAIERLRQSSPQRSPQGYMDNPFASEQNWQFQMGDAPPGVRVQNEDPNVITASPLKIAEPSLVQPLEGGGYQPGALDDSRMGSVVQPLEDQRDVRVENSLNHLARAMDNSPYTALRDPRLRQEMFNAMVRESGGLQTDATLKAIDSLDQTQFLAQKSAAQLNQQAAQTEAQLEVKQLQQELAITQRAADIAARSQDRMAADQLKAQTEMLRATIASLRNLNPAPARSRGGGKEDPDVVDYRKQLNQFSQRLSSMESEVIRKFGVLNPRNVARLVKTNSREWGPTFNEAQRLYQLGKSNPKFSGVLNNYKGLGSIVGESTSGGGGQSPRGGGGSNQSRAAEALKARGVK